MKQTIQIADKPTLDKVKSLLEDSGYGLEALKKLLEEQDSKQIFYKGLEGYENYILQHAEPRYMQAIVAE